MIFFSLNSLYKQTKKYIFLIPFIKKNEHSRNIQQNIFKMGFNDGNC